MKDTTNITRQEAENIIRGSKGKVFSVTFIKKDKTERTLQARIGVTKYLKGGESTIKNHKEYITVFDMNSSYRNVNIDTILSIAFGKKVFKVIE